MIRPPLGHGFPHVLRKRSSRYATTLSGRAASPSRGASTDCSAVVGGPRPCSPADRPEAPQPCVRRHMHAEATTGRCVDVDRSGRTRARASAGGVAGALRAVRPRAFRRCGEATAHPSGHGDRVAHHHQSEHGREQPGRPGHAQRPARSDGVPLRCSPSQVEHQGGHSASAETKLRPPL
jgi:hypothetical protein